MNEERPSAERSGERDSQLSAMFDGELPAAECELLARRLVRDEALRSQWSRYSMIGAAVRAERGVALDDRVAKRVQSALAQEAAYGDSAAVDVAATNATRPATGAARTGGMSDPWMRIARPVFGAGIAAGVAALSILWLRTQGGPDSNLVASNPTPAKTAAPVVGTPVAVSNLVALNAKPAAARPVHGTGEPGAYTTPAPRSQPGMAPPARLANYVVAHSEYSGPLSRRLALLSLIGNEGAADAAPTEDSVTAPKAEAAGNGR